jgi:CHAT domain-containing protein
MHARAQQATKQRLESRRPIFTRRAAIIILIAAFLIAAGSTAWWWQRQSNVAAAMRLLIGKFSEQRPVAGRLAGGFKGGRFVSMTDDGILKSPEIIKAIRLMDQARSANEPGCQLGYARLLLLTNQTGMRTLKTFRQAVTAEPASAAAHNDLGVCLLARSQLEEALEAFNNALQQQPGMSEALFNRALCYQQLQLRGAASTEFAQLLEVERDRSWRDEISQRHDEVSAAISPDRLADDVAAAFDRAMAADDVAEASRVIDDNTETAFNHVFNDCLLIYLKAVANGETEVSAQELAKIKLIGQRLAATCGDHSLLDLAAYVQGLSRQEAANELALLRESMGGDREFKDQTLAEIQTIWERLRTQFRSRGNQVYEFNLAFQDVGLDYRRRQFGKAMSKMRDVLQIATTHRWSYWRALALVQMANTCASTGQDSVVIKYCQQATLEFQNFPKVQSKALQAMANACWRLGKISDGLQHLRESSEIFSKKYPSREDLANNSLQAADFYRLINNHGLALLYAREALPYAEAEGSALWVAQTVSFMAVELAQLNRFEESAAEMQRALNMVEKIPPDRRGFTEALVQMRVGEIASQQGDWRLAEQHHDKAVTIAQHTQKAELLLIKILKARATNFVQAGQPQRAQVDLEHAIALIEAYRKQITESSNRSDFFDASQDVFDQMIQLQARTFGQWRKAFDTSEQARARSLLDDLLPASRAVNTPLSTTPAAPPSGGPLTLSQIRADLPKELTLISYSVSSAGSIIFVVTRQGFAAVESAATTEMLDGLVENYLTALSEQASLEELAEPSRKLYELLIAPVEGKLGAATQLCIAPDKALHRLPFAALLDARGRYFVQSHSLMGAPSASTLIYCTRQARRKAMVADEKLLAVSNPQLNHDHFDLSALPDAQREANEIAIFYHRRAILTGPEATKARALVELTTCDVAQFSTHCLVEERTPWLAALVLASTTADGEDDLLRLNEFNKIGLLRARLVILSACQSALGQYYRGEGIVSLVRPFLARSVPTVVASLWPVDSQATASLMIDFHRARRQNHSPTAEALRAAQLQMMQGDSFNHPYYWAPFVVIGSN